MNIAITGEGIISAIGCGKEQTLHALRARESGIGTMKYLQSVHTELPVGEVKMDNATLRRMAGVGDADEVSRTVLMGVVAARQALDDARLTLNGAATCRVALISGTTVGGMDVTERHFSDLVEGRDVEHLRHHDCGSSTRQMAELLGHFADVITVSTACSSAANAIALGARMLKAGEADVVLAGGTEALTRFHLNGFNSLMILDHERCRPLDGERAGLNLGEGAAFVVMERAESAAQRGAGIHAYLTGYGNACDAFHQTATSENGEGAFLAMTEALRSAGLRPGDIGYVNAHATGTPDNDASETAALLRVFGQEMPPVSGTKGFTGHATSAAGGIESVICLWAMADNFIPANLGWENPMSGGIVPSMGEENVSLDHVMCNSFGFGGNDTSLIFSKAPAAHGAEDVCPVADSDIRVAARVELQGVERLSEIRRFVGAMEVRRMGKLMKGAMLSSLLALEEAGLQKPDAIITGTSYGCLDNSERLLMQMEENGESMLQPTLFMQSTHNTIGSAVAIKTGCHGYNATYTQGADSLDCALRDARLLLRSGQCKSVLVGCHDETTPMFRSLLQQLGQPEAPELHSISLLLICGN